MKTWHFILQSSGTEKNPFRNSRSHTVGSGLKESSDATLYCPVNVSMQKIRVHFPINLNLVSYYHKWYAWIRLSVMHYCFVHILPIYGLKALSFLFQNPLTNLKFFQKVFWFLNDAKRYYFCKISCNFHIVIESLV